VGERERERGRSAAPMVYRRAGVVHLLHITSSSVVITITTTSLLCYDVLVFLCVFSFV
jgi:hypothetical protein